MLPFLPSGQFSRHLCFFPASPQYLGESKLRWTHAASHYVPDGISPKKKRDASSWNRFWHEKLLNPNTIATEPPRGKHGARSNQYAKALKRLAWNNHLLRQLSTPTNNRIQHTNNRGKLRIANFLVDGYDATACTVYEFNRCLWHGCTRCHPHPHRDKYSKLRPDRTLKEMRCHETQTQTSRVPRIPGCDKVGVRVGP